MLSGDIDVERELVPDSETALSVGVAILIAYYGKELIDRFYPYNVESLGEDWAVTGTAPAHLEAQEFQRKLGPEHFVLLRGGGAPEIAISKKDARVVQIGIGR